MVSLLYSKLPNTLFKINLPRGSPQTVRIRKLLVTLGYSILPKRCLLVILLTYISPATTFQKNRLPIRSKQRSCSPTQLKYAVPTTSTMVVNWFCRLVPLIVPIAYHYSSVPIPRTADQDMKSTVLVLTRLYSKYAIK